MWYICQKSDKKAKQILIKERVLFGFYCLLQPKKDKKQMTRLKVNLQKSSIYDIITCRCDII